jgi:hypothetical protein
MNPHEYQYRRTGRSLTILFAFYLPVVGLLGLAMVKLFGVTWPVFVFAGLWMAACVLFSVLRFIAYYRWRERRPFSWLR